MLRLVVSLLLFPVALWVADCAAQEQSVRPGINESYQNPDVDAFVERFEIESREVYAHRQEIVEACQIKPGQTVADIGAGTGLFTRLFAQAVGQKGKVFAVDIAKNFLEHIQKTSRQLNLKTVKTVLASDQSANLPEGSVDVAFICDTYHHFEFPQKTMASIHKALKPGGRVMLIDFHRIPGKSSEWTLDHVRAGQEVFEREIEEAGFRKTREVKDLLEDNYFVEFTKVETAAAQTAPE